MPAPPPLTPDEIVLGLRLLVRRPRHEAGEGVISTGIAVLIMAFIGVAGYALFSASMEQAADKTDEKIAEIGEGASTAPTP